MNVASHSLLLVFAVSLYVITSRSGRLVAWSYIIRQAPRARWFRMRVPLPESFHMTIEWDLLRRVNRSEEGLFPRKIQATKVNKEAYFDSSFTYICTQRRHRENIVIGSDDGLVSIRWWLSLLTHKCVTLSWCVNRCNPIRHLAKRWCQCYLSLKRTSFQLNDGTLLHYV